MAKDIGNGVWEVEITAEIREHVEAFIYARRCKECYGQD